MPHRGRIGLPKMNGMDAALRIFPESKIIFVSVESSADLIREAFRIGAWDYVLKKNAGTGGSGVFAVLQKSTKRGGVRGAVMALKAMKKWVVLSAVLVLLAGLLFAAPAKAQVAGATLTGTITDAQGGAVASAKVSANLATGVSDDTMTNGTYLSRRARRLHAAQR
jgi:hypothetical protein